PAELRDVLLRRLFEHRLVLRAGEAEGHVLVNALHGGIALHGLAVGEVRDDVIAEEQQVLVAAFGNRINRREPVARALRDERRATGEKGGQRRRMEEFHARPIGSGRCSRTAWSTRRSRACPPSSRRGPPPHSSSRLSRLPRAWTCDRRWRRCRPPCPK